MSKISVVIPVYNVKPYLERCVQSVLRQTYKSIEIILVDDGSTDGSGELSDQIASQDTRIHVIHQNNKGLSGARNTGLYYATGEFVVFLDSDDEWLLPEGLELLFRESSPKCDLIVFKRVDIWNNHREYCTDYNLKVISTLPDAQAIFKYLVNTRMFQMSACFLITRRKVLIDYNIIFPEGLVSEDISWSLHLWQCVHTVTFHNLSFYGYYHREESITTTTSIRSYQSIDRIFAHWKNICQDECVNKYSILSFLANIWVSLGYQIHLLQSADRLEAINILNKNKDLLRHATTSKTRITAILVKTIGFRGTITLLNLYWQSKTVINGNKV